MLSHRKKLLSSRTTGSVSHRSRGLTPPAAPIVPAAAQPTMWLRTAPDTFYLPPIDRTSYALIRATDFPDAATMFGLYPDVLDYLCVLDGGNDFTSWGTWNVANMSGTLGRYRTIRFFNATDDWRHPYARVGGNELLFPAVQFTGTSAYWAVVGMTQRGILVDNDIRDTAHHVVFSRFLLQDCAANYGIKSRGGDGCIVQQTFFDSPVQGQGLIAISPDPNDGPLAGFKALDNEVRNWVDGILVGYNPVDGFVNISVHSEGNDYYADGTRYLAGSLATLENGIDIKGSSDLVQCVSRRDRIRGMRQYVGHAAGDAVEVHRWARNWLFDELFVENCRFGVFETNWDAPTDPETPRDMVFTGCQFARMSAYSAGTGAGAIFRINNNYDVSDSWFHTCDGIMYIYSTLRAGGPSFVGNTATSTPVAVAGSVSEPYDAGANSTGDPDAVPQLIECNRWSGPVFVYGARLGAPLENREPVAAFSTTRVGAVVQVADESVAYDSTIVSWNYDWGDGSGDSTTQNPSHTYAANGPYTIDLVVNDSNGLTHRTQRHVMVTGLAEPEMPVYEGYGTVLKTTAGGSPGLPTGVVQHDILVAVTVSQGTEPVTASAAQGYTQVTGSPVDVGLASGSALGVWWRRVGSRAVGQADELDAALIPVWNDPGNHLMSVVFRIRRAVRTGDPFEVVAYDVLTTSSVDVAIPGGTTVAANRLVLAMCTTGFDGDAGQFSGWASTAPALANLTERFNEGTSQGNGSGLGVVTGERAAQGAFGQITATLANIFRQARMTLAIKGQEP